MFVFYSVVKIRFHINSFTFYRQLYKYLIYQESAILHQLCLNIVTKFEVIILQILLQVTHFLLPVGGAMTYSQ